MDHCPHCGATSPSEFVLAELAVAAQKSCQAAAEQRVWISFFTGFVRTVLWNVHFVSHSAIRIGWRRLARLRYRSR